MPYCSDKQPFYLHSCIFQFIEQKATAIHEIFRVFFCPITIGVSISWLPTNLFHVPRLATRTFQYNSGTSTCARDSRGILSSWARVAWPLNGTPFNCCMWHSCVCSVWFYIKEGDLGHPPSYWLRLFSSQTFSLINTPTFWAHKRKPNMESQNQWRIR